MEGRDKRVETRVDICEGERLPKESFVVVEDIRSRMKDWLGEKGFTVRTRALDTYAKAIDTIVAQTFTGIDSVPTMTLGENEIAVRATVDIGKMIKSLGGKRRVGVVTLDPSYAQMLAGLGIATGELEMTRTVSATGENTGTLDVRSGARSIADQVNAIRNRFAQKGIMDVIIADDVFYSGNQALRAIDLLKESGLRVVGAYAGVATTESLSILAEKAQSSGLPEFKIGATYSGEARDIIDMRDLTPGAPGGGRTLAETNNVGLPYLLPFGNPSAWASIPEGKTAVFSRAVLDAAITFYQEIERDSEKIIRLKDLERAIYNASDGSSTLTEGDESLVAWLKKQRDTLPG